MNSDPSSTRDSMPAADLGGQLPLHPLEFLVLLCLADQPLHGYGLVRAIEERSSGRVTPRPGNLYRVLDRLLERGWIRVAERDADELRSPQGGPKPRRIFRCTELGRRLATAEAELRVDVQAGSPLAPAWGAET